MNTESIMIDIIPPEHLFLFFFFFFSGVGIVFTENDYTELPEKVWLHYSTNIGGKNHRIIGTYPLKFPRHFVLKSATVGTDLIGDTFNSFATLKNRMRSCQCDDTYSRRRKEVNPTLLHGWRALL